MLNFKTKGLHDQIENIGVRTQALEKTVKMLEKELDYYDSDLVEWQGVVETADNQLRKNNV